MREWTAFLRLCAAKYRSGGIAVFAEGSCARRFVRACFSFCSGRKRLAAADSAGCRPPAWMRVLLARLPPMRKERLGGMTHPCPAGQGYAVGVRDRRCLPLRGKSASELARLILVCRGGKQGAGALCPSGTVGRRARKTKHTLLRSMRPPSPRNHPAGGTAGFARTRSRDQSLENPFLGDGGRFPAASPSPERRRRQALARGLAAVCAHSCPKRNESQPVCPLRVEQTGVNSEPTALAAGTAGPAGSARTRSRDQSLENPFLGNRRFLRRPVPKNRRRRQAPARGPAAVYSFYRPNRNEPQHTHPLLVGWVCVEPEPTALAGGPAALPPCRPEQGTCSVNRP